MQVTVLFFAHLRQEMGLDRLTLDIPAGLSARELSQLLEQQHPVRLQGCMVAVNEQYAAPDQLLCEHDEIAWLPPVAGGSDHSSAIVEDTLCELTEKELSLSRAAEFLVRPWCGAQAYFVGTVRTPNAGQGVDWIEYQAYTSMAQQVMLSAALVARQTHGDLRIFIQHRLGTLKPGEASILIGVASPHRRPALDACDFLIEELKAQLPVWKHEMTSEGPQWVPGQTGHEAL